MAFPTLLPVGSTMLTQPGITKVEMQEYTLHLMHYYDSRFGQHTRFHYCL